MNINLHPTEKEPEDFYVQCNVCKQVLKNWIGSTPCCGSIAYSCDADGSNVSSDLHLFGFIANKSSGISSSEK